MLDQFCRHILDIWDSYSHLLDNTLVIVNMLSGSPYTYHPFHNYLQQIANLEERIVTADTLLIYL